MNTTPNGLIIPNHIRVETRTDQPVTPAVEAAKTEGKKFPMAPRVCACNGFAVQSAGVDNGATDFVMMTLQGFDILELSEKAGDAQLLAFTGVIDYYAAIKFANAIKEQAGNIPFARRSMPGSGLFKK